MRGSPTLSPTLIVPSSGLPDILLITLHSDDPNFDFDLLSSKFIGRTDSADAVLINSVRVDLSQESSPVIFKFEDRKQLYDSEKLLNLEQRYVRISLFNYYPYSSFEEVVSGGSRNDSIRLTTGNCFCSSPQARVIATICS